MSNPLRWSVAVSASMITFALCLWLGGSARLGWMPQAQEIRWGIATSFAGVAATAVGAAVNWWATRNSFEPGPTTPQDVRQNVQAAEEADVIQVAGDDGGGRVGRTTGSLTQSVNASGQSRVTQVGGNRRPTRAKRHGR